MSSKTVMPCFVRVLLLSCLSNLPRPHAGLWLLAWRGRSPCSEGAQVAIDRASSCGVDTRFDKERCMVSVIGLSTLSFLAVASITTKLI